MGYASRTKVSTDRSMAEIRKILSRYKIPTVAFGENPTEAIVIFETNERRIKCILPLPVSGQWRNKKRIIGSNIQVDQEKRRLWRSLALYIKSKLEAVDAGIVTFEEAFMAHIVLPNGQTMGEVAIPQISQSYSSGKMPPLLGYSGR